MKIFLSQNIMNLLKYVMNDFIYLQEIKLILLPFTDKRVEIKA